MSLDEIRDLRAKAEHIYADVKDFYYWDRVEAFNQYYRRFAKWLLLRKDLGIDQEGFLTPKNKVLNMTRFQLDSGPLTLHFMTFIPTLELLCSKE